MAFLTGQLFSFFSLYHLFLILFLSNLSCCFLGITSLYTLSFLPAMNWPLFFVLDMQGFYTPFLFIFSL